MLLPHFLESSLKMIYEKEWDVNSPKIKKQYNVKKISKIICSCAARRDGKTTIVSAWICLLALFLTREKDYHFVVVSKDKEASQTGSYISK